MLLQILLLVYINAMLKRSILISLATLLILGCHGKTDRSYKLGTLLRDIQGDDPTLYGNYGDRPTLYGRGDNEDGSHDNDGFGECLVEEQECNCTLETTTECEKR